MEKKHKKVLEVLQNGGIVVMPSDTIYGVFAVAQNKKVVEKLYKVRKRKKNKACIILIADIKELDKFGIKIDRTQEKFILSKKDKNPTTFIVRCPLEKYAYLHRGLGTLAFRIPSQKTKRSRALLILLKATGPLIAPSANLPGKAPARTISEAKKYFGKKVDYYLAYGRSLNAKPSQIIDITQKKINHIR